MMRMMNMILMMTAEKDTELFPVLYSHVSVSLEQTRYFFHV